MTETERLLALLNEGFPDIAALTPLEARAAVDRRVRPATNLSDAAAFDFTIPATTGPLNVRLYQPQSNAPYVPVHPKQGRQARKSAQKHDVVTVFAHGGGFLHGSIASHDSFCRSWARHTGTPVVSVEIRLAPEHAAPASAEDLVAAAEWVVASSLGRRVVLAGDSSGANAAAVASLMLRDSGTIPLAGQVLLYPFLDPFMHRRSHQDCATGYFVTARALGFYWKNYLDAGALAPEDWRINPANSSDHRGLPPTIIVTAGLDPLSDEGRDYARTLSTCEVKTVHRHYPDQFHGFATIAGFGPAHAAQAQLWTDFRQMCTTNLELTV
jgi:acetyl esterase